MSLLPSESAFRYQLPTRRVGSGCYSHNRGGRNAADHREQGSAGSAPGALAQTVISTIEAVGTPPNDANKPAGAPRPLKRLDLNFLS